MNIVFVSRLFLPHLGGVEVHVKEISSLLVKQGHQVTIVTSQHNKKLALSTQYDEIKIIRLPNYAGDKKLATFKEILKLSSVFTNADIIHAHDVFWWLLPIFPKIKNKVFTTFHGWETKYPISMKAKLHRLLVAKLSQGTIHVGGWVKNFYLDKPDFVTYGGVNPKRLTRSGELQKSQKNSEELLQKVVNIVFIGRLSQDNEVEKYLTLTKKLKTSGLNYKMTWVGDGNLRSECEKIGEVTGFIKNPSKYLSTADLVFANSYLSILEAQLLGKVVCAFHSNDLKKAYLESFPGSKHMLIAESPKKMLKKINLLFGSKKVFDKCSKDARNFAKEQTWDKVLELYLKLWGTKVGI
jgi:glycosyltransferase involved in cell wall biosynthesis